jgi:hypothetical protein
MYTLYMSWPFRAVVFGVLVSLGTGPQLACFMPDQTVTQADMDCCKEMIGACAAPDMSHGCCQVTAPTELALAAQAAQQVIPRLELADSTADIAPDILSWIDGTPSSNTNHAPPDKHRESLVILRI